MSSSIPTETDSPPCVPRGALVWFAEQMERVLGQNDHKGGWDSLPNEYLMHRLYEEMEELEEAIGSPCPSCGQHRPWRSARKGHDWQQVIDEATDVANLAMMIADNARRRMEVPHGGEL